MKKIWNFLKSMQFGLFLLGLICVVSIVGSLIPQNEGPMTYVRAYPNHYSLIFALDLDHVFTSWYFIVLVVLLCLNLTFCSIIRITKIKAMHPEIAAAKVHAVEKLTPEGVEKVHQYLGKSCRKEVHDDITVYTKNHVGRYGTFLTHLGILLTMIFWAMAMYMPKITDQTCMPKESITLDDGTRIYVDDFSITDENGRLDYHSIINIILPDQKASGLKPVSVNHPVGMGQYKVYQQTYGTRGRISVKDTEGHVDSFYVDTNDFLSADGKNGILYDNVYPDYNDENGELSLVSSTSGSYENPVYIFTTIEDGAQNEVMLAFPGDEIEIGGLTFHFEDPVEYPGLRIKKSPAFINIFQLFSFLVMTVGLYMTFFMQEVIVSVDPNGYTVLGSKPEAMRMTLRQLTRKYKEVQDA